MKKKITCGNIFLTLIFSWLYSITDAQNDSTGGPLSYGLRVHYSYLFVHVKDLLPDDNYFPKGIEFSFSKTLLGKKAWDQCNCYPKTGLLITAFDYDNPKVLGQGYSASWYIEPVFKAYRKINFSTRAAFGLAFLTTPYHTESNPLNQAYSMYGSAYVLLNAGVNWRVNENWLMNLAININHNSNGGLKDPNKGLNFPSFSLGAEYLPAPWPIKKRERTGLSKSESGRLRREFFMFYSNRAIAHGEKKRYGIYGISGGVSKRITHISALYAGAEAMLDYALEEKLNRKGYGDRDFKRVGILGGHEFLMGRFTFGQQLGLYIYNPAGFSDWYFLHDDILYQRYNLKYQATKYIIVGVDLKVHRYVANFVDFKVGAYF